MQLGRSDRRGPVALKYKATASALNCSAVSLVHCVGWTPVEFCAVQSGGY